MGYESDSEGAAVIAAENVFAFEPAAIKRQTIATTATGMIYASLPHSKLMVGEKEVGSICRKSSAHNLTIVAHPLFGLPYGKIPRLLTLFLCTEVSRTKDRRIDLGRSQAEFAKKLGLRSTGGPRGDLTRIKEQCMRLFTSTFWLTPAKGSQEAEHDDIRPRRFVPDWKGVLISSEGHLWKQDDPNVPSLWPGSLDLTHEFFADCMAHPVPVDLDIVRRLRSPLAIDIYIWLTYRYNAIKRPTHISWRQLGDQFGKGYNNDNAGLANFTHDFKEKLRAVKTLYPGANFALDDDKLTLYKSEPSVAPRTSTQA